jgi:hypothetical protein
MIHNTYVGLCEFLGQTKTELNYIKYCVMCNGDETRPD